MRLPRLWPALTAALSLPGLTSALPGRAPAPQLDVCPNPALVDLQPIEYEYLNPIYVSTFVPKNTKLHINDDLVIHVTDAPRTVSTVLIDTSVTVITLTRFVSAKYSCLATSKWI
jgi:hypothetical protein